MHNKNAKADEIAEALRGFAPVAVAAQGTFGCNALQQLGGLATSESLRFAHGNKHRPIQNAAIQKSDDGVINRSGIIARGFRFGALQELLSKIEAGEVKAAVVYHDAEFSDDAENALLRRIVEKVPFSLLLEPIPSDLAKAATATLPVATYLEESDFVIGHQGDEKHYSQVLEPPGGVKTPAAWVRELSAVAAAVG
jgi:anaerobic selenocysteine-containing dehydrogenase